MMWRQCSKATVEELNAISGIGEVIATAFVDYFSDNVHRELCAIFLRNS